jgi:hypothetical protein
MYKTATEVETALAKPYDGPTKEIDGFTYIPANESRKTLDRIWGPLGWSESNPVITADPEHGIYVAAQRIAGYVTDENGTVREVGRVGFGRATAQASKKERDDAKDAGRPIPSVTKILKLHDTAAAAAGTDAFSRACKKFGPALGSDLYDGRTDTETHNTSYSRPTSQNATRRGPSDGQRKWLKSLGHTDAAIDEMPFSTWRGILDKASADKKQSSETDELPY